MKQRVVITGAAGFIASRVCALLHDEGMDDVLVTAGGIIPDDDIPALKEAGVETSFVLIPAHGHFPGDPVRSREVWRRWIAWLEPTLK